MKWFSVLRIMWEYINGKKTNAGTITMLVGLLAIFLPMAGFDIDEEVLTQAVIAVIGSGAFAALIGLIHKYMKKD